MQSPPAQTIPPLQDQYTPPPMHHDDEYLFPATYVERERSHGLAYLPPPEESIMPPYGAVQAYPPMLTETYSEYLSSAPVSVSLPLMMHFSDAIKQDTGYPSGEPVDEGLLLYTGYSGCPLPGVDLSTRQPSPCDQIPHTELLSKSYDHSPAWTDLGSCDAYPTTPLPMHGLPGFL